jgi:hypothetical protein
MSLGAKQVEDVNISAVTRWRNDLFWLSRLLNSAIKISTVWRWWASRTVKTKEELEFAGEHGLLLEVASE